MRKHILFTSIFNLVLLAALTTIMTVSARNLDQAVGGKTYYVNQNNANAADDTTHGTEAKPWKTIQYAADQAVAGDTIIVKAGTYNERVVPKNSGTSPDAKITFIAAPRRSVTMWGFYTVNSDYLHIEGFNITTDPSLTGWTEQSGVFINSDYVEVVDNYFYNIEATAISGYWHEPYPQAAYIANNKIYHSQMGIGIQGSDWIVEGNEVERLFMYGEGDSDYSRFFGDNHIIRNNYFHGTNFDEIGSAHVDCFQTFTNNGEHAYNILFEGNICYDFHQALMASNVENTATSHFTFRNNIFAHGLAWGLCVHNVSYITAENNLFADIQYHGAGFRDNSVGNVIRNNIFYNVSSSYWASDGGQVSGDYNLIFNANPPAVPGEHDILDVDPLFVDPAHDDFRLQFGSPARDKGQALPEVGFDIDHNPRPYGSGWDIGAYEFVPTLDLVGIADSQAIHLAWAINMPAPTDTTWQIDYYTQTASTYTTTIALDTARSSTLTEHVQDYQWYTVTLYALRGETIWLSDTVRVMPTDRLIYLPSILK